jgi:ABC-type transporter Mla subunit MlaD
MNFFLGFSKTATRIKETNDRLEDSINEVLKTVSDTQSAAESFYDVTKKGHETLKTEIAALNSLEKISLQTSENVLDTKRRVEYGVHQILLEVTISHLLIGPLAKNFVCPRSVMSSKFRPRS